MAKANYITNANLFLVENSGIEGYFYEPEYFTTLSDARRKQQAWLNIGISAKITVIEVTGRVFNAVNFRNGGVSSLFDLIGENGVTLDEINVCLNPDNYEEELSEETNLFEEWLTDGKNGGALEMLAKYQESVTA